MSGEAEEGLVVPEPDQERPLTPTAPPLETEEPPAVMTTTDPVPTTIPIPTPTPTARTVPAVMPTVFGEIYERNVTFCIDTSGSMFKCLHVVKEQLIEALMKHALREGDTTFNIIEFNSEVTQWSDKMVVCTPETVQVATDWIRKLEAKTGTNTLDALLTALQDSACQAVFLVTDGLPDSFADDIIDIVIQETRNRPIHCIYLTGETADTASVEFLEDLAVESFGSFHIASLTTHGCVERVTPIYRADHANERVVRTVNNTLRPNLKNCSVTTTLQIDPDEILGYPQNASLGLLGPPHCPPWWSWRYWGMGTFPFRYHFPSTWSRYRPAKSWLRAQDKMADFPDAGLSPSAGALLINKKVLARRIADGYFYMGTVQSQILEDKFLIAFGPCKHGKYRETAYQDTFVFDIVDYIDAQRHTIITGDHVLAPWEPEAEKHGPGIVIDGQEKRQSIDDQTSGPDDHQLTVAFTNGHTEKVVMDKAIWIPQVVYERVSLELKMPKDTREAIMTTDHYPLQNMPGYPTSGPQATPPEYYTPDNFVLEPTGYGMWDRWMYPQYLGYYPPYPLVLRKKQEQKEKEKEVEDEDFVIPGTDMTKKQLDERVQSQLSEHTSTQLSHTSTMSSTQQSVASRRLLKKRKKLEPENTLKKSVTFNESDLVQVSTDRDPRTDADSGIASSPELETDPAVQEHWDRIDRERQKILQEKLWIKEQKRMLEEEEKRIREDPRLQFYRSPGVGKRPPWQYWRSDPSPEIPSSGDSGGGGGSRRGVQENEGAFRETALQAPLEARDQKRSPYIVTWTSPSFKYVDTFAKHDYSNSVEECLRTPHPPAPPSGDANYNVPEPQPPSEDEKAEARRAYRRKRYMQRQMAWQEKLENEESMKNVMQDCHRERIQAQITQEQERQQQEWEMINKAREAKKKISKEICARIEENQEREKEREANRLNAMKARRERREAIEAQREKEIEETKQRREEIRRQNCLKRHDATTTRLDEEAKQKEALNQQHRNAKFNRMNHFHNLEEQARAKKDLRVAVTNQHAALYRSQIFS